MNKNLKTFIIIIACLLIGGGSLALGALTAPSSRPVLVQQQTPTQTPSPKPVKESLEDKLKREQPIITTILTTAYPKAATDYTMSKARLHSEGKWFTAILTYKGTDTMNRDTLRVLAQKKDSVWILRTTPPEIILSSQKYKDVPESVLKTINKPVSLPGTDTSPTITPAG